MVVDTDVLIDHFHGHGAATEFVRNALLQGHTLIISVVTVAEILAGMRSHELEITESLLSLFVVHDANAEVARTAGTYLNRYGRSHRLDLGDAFVAATAKAAGSPLYRRNIRHYPMDDVQVVVPYERGG